MGPSPDQGSDRYCVRPRTHASSSAGCRSTISPMRIRTVVSLSMVAALAVVATHAQITSNPIPVPVEKRGVAVEIRDVVRLPDTRGLRPLTEDVNPSGWARVSFVRDTPDGRRF